MPPCTRPAPQRRAQGHVSSHLTDRSGHVQPQRARRSRPSCTVVATSVPSCVVNVPVASPREPDADGEKQCRAATRRRGTGGGTTSRGPDSPSAWSWKPGRGGDHRTQQRHVAGVGEHADVQQLVVGERAVGPHPHPRVVGGAAVAVTTRARRRSACRSGAGSGPATRRRPPPRPARRSSATTPATAPDRAGHGVLQPVLPLLERRRQREDHLAALHGQYPTGGERATVAHPLELVDDRHPWVAGADEVGVQRVHLAVIGNGRARPRPAPARRPARRTPGWGCAAG